MSSAISTDSTDKNIQAIAKMERAADARRTLGDHVADTFVHVVGSWKFIIIQSVLLVLWVTLNIIGWIHHWDPYPFTLLNLALSFQAAYASPIIMMSQNRQGWLAERRNHLDLQINLLAEQESTETLRLLRALCKKMDITVGTKESDGLEKETEPSQIVEQIERSIQNPGEKPAASA